VLAEEVLVAERKSAGTEIGLVGENDEDLVVVRYIVGRWGFESLILSHGASHVMMMGAGFVDRVLFDADK